MAVDNMCNIHVSPDVLSTLMLLQHDNLYKLQQQILHDISRSCRPEEPCDKAALKTYTALQKLETPIQVFSCEFCESFKSNYFKEHL